jgi:thioredoxin reductase (NADPH)
MAETYDMVIIGGGAAGFTAGIYAARDRCRALLLERMAAGGQVLNCEHIENYPGFPDGIAGYMLGPLLQQQAMQLGLAVQLAEVEAVRREGDLHVVQTGDGVLYAKTVVIATGSSFATLGVPGEEAFLGKGVSHCAACDGALFMERPVAVIGGGDAALDEALYLTQYASQVTIVHRRDALRACQLLQERAQANTKLTFRWHTVVRAIEGDDVVQCLQLEDVTTGERSALAVAGVFPYLGLVPNTQFLHGLVPLNGRGQIVTDLWMRTVIPGVLAAGDVRSASARQLIAAAGDGATAALAAIRYLRTGQWGE